VEMLVLSEKWGHLFKPWDRKQAEENLRLAEALRVQSSRRSNSG